MSLWQQFTQAAAALGGSVGDFTSMDLNALNNQWAAAQNAQMQPMLDNIVQQNMANPQVQQAYHQHRMQGGPLSLEQFAYQWAATGGFSAPGMAAYRQSEQINQSKEQAAWQGVQQAEQQRGAAQSQMAAHYSHNQQVAGQNLMGQATYATPVGPQVLPYNLAPGLYQTPQGNYVVDAQRNYWFVDAWGYHHPIQPQAGYPFC